jgi:nucleoside 2-deoxyribosyltransferase
MSQAEWDIFVAASVRQPGCHERNEAVSKAARRVGLSAFLPQEQFPLQTSHTAVEILLGNDAALRRSRAVIFIPDDAGEGVYFEIGIAFALGKHIIGYSELDNTHHLGKIPQAIWELIPAVRKAHGLAELENLLVCLRNANQLSACGRGGAMPPYM